MALRLSLVLAALSYGLAVLALLVDTTHRETKRACSTIRKTAISVATKLQTSHFSSALGYYEGNIEWTDANTIEDIYNLMHLSNVSTWRDLIYQTQIGQLGLAHLDLWDFFFNGSFDDAGWTLLLFIRFRDFIGPKDGNFQYFETSTYQVYDYIVGEYTSDCGGGVWWSRARNYKNTITNALFMHISAAMYIRHRDTPGYLQNAIDTWKWLAGSGLRDKDHLWFDGLRRCQVSDRRKWTYNQGVIASGLGLLYAATGNKTYLTEAEKTLDAAIDFMTVNGILKEVCDDATQSTCDEDQLIFKGIFTKHLQYYIDQAGRAARDKYSVFLSVQSSAVYFYSTGADNAKDPGSVWYHQDNGGSIYTPRSIASGLEAHIAAAKVGLNFSPLQ
ncbi:Six-hairpin glycosidase [Thelephora ganbajun]|uniref:Six-hairpin glycosidase n=1 Tax=Thelephora ganbajun TaxID=370292 RepID=A0ACB6Z0X8_THEGA|nr:Six-hairpin glycosidase [Thelephora ganbajun]